MAIPILEEIPDPHLPPSLTQKQRLRMWLELGAVVVLTIAGLCTLKTTRGYVIAAGALFVWYTFDSHQPRRKSTGLWKHSRQTLWMLEFGFCGILLIYLVGLIWGPAREIDFTRENLIFGKLGYFLGAWLQQIVVLSYCYVRLEKLLQSHERARTWISRVFGLLHFPNFLLMGISWGGCWVSCTIFRRFRNVHTLAMLHGMIGAAMAAFWPGWVMRAGIGFFKHWGL